MSQYFTPPPRLQSVSKEPVDRQRVSHSVLAPLDESTVYIFPNPSSTPGTPSQNSSVPIHPDLLLALETESWQHSVHSNHWSPLHTPSYPHSPLSSISANWEAVSYSSDIEQVGDTPTQDDFLSENTAEELPQNAFSHITSASQTNTHEQPSSRSPDHDNSLPFLALLTSLLSVDESTVQLLTNDTDQSVLFPGHAVQYLDNKNDETQARSTQEVDVHGLDKLILENKFSSQHTLRRAFHDIIHDWDFFSPNTSPLLPTSERE